MTIASTKSNVSFKGTSAYLDWLQMLTGAGLIIFMWSHMIMVSSVLVSVELMNEIAEFLEGTYLAQIGGVAILFAVLLHGVLAARKMPFRSAEQKAFREHSRLLKHYDTTMWMFQVVTAMAILIMGCIHVWVILTNLPITAESSAARVGNGWLYFYMLLLPIAEIHVGVGFYRIGVKWGFVRRRGRKFFKALEILLTLGFISIGGLTLMRFLSLAAE